MCIYNRKYGRDGHLFKERFKSEPVNDLAYFTTLLRYIHQNPVKAGIVGNVKDYAYSSWGEYEGTVDPVFRICDTQVVLNRIPFGDLKAWVDDLLSDVIHCLEFEGTSRLRPSDDEVWSLIVGRTGVTNSCAFQQLPDERQRAILKQLKEMGASHRQLERLTGVGRGVIQEL